MPDLETAVDGFITMCRVFVHLAPAKGETVDFPQCSEAARNKPRSRVTSVS